MATSVEKYKPTLITTTSSVKPQKDFLKEHRLYLKNMQETRKNIKERNVKTSIELGTTSEMYEHRNFVVSKSARETKRSAVLTPPPAPTKNRRTAIIHIDRQIPKLPSTKLSQVIDKKDDKKIVSNNVSTNNISVNTVPSLICNQYVQTCDMEDESFLQNATFLEPSAACVLEIIKDKKLSNLESEQSLNNVQKLSTKMESHLTNLKEFMDKGSISKRKEIEAQRRLNLQKYMERRRSSNYGTASAVPVPKNSTLKYNSGLLGNRGNSKVPTTMSTPHVAKKDPIVEAGNIAILQNTE